jgi:hypothetical protein
VFARSLLTLLQVPGVFPQYAFSGGIFDVPFQTGKPSRSTYISTAARCPCRHNPSAMSADPSSSTPAPVLFGAEIKRKPRTLVLCFDGTGNEYDDTVGLCHLPFPRAFLGYNLCCCDVPQNTNVVKLYSTLRKDKVEDQLCYYQVSAPFSCFERSHDLTSSQGRRRNISCTGHCFTTLPMGRAASRSSCCLVSL